MKELSLLLFGLMLLGAGLVSAADGVFSGFVPEGTLPALVEGPMAGVSALPASETPQTVSGKLTETLPGRGALSFWFRTDQTYRTGIGVKPVNFPLIEVRDAVSVLFQGDADMVTLMVQWDDPWRQLFGRHVRIQLPELSGPRWHHFALHWDGETGDVNAWVDGTPFYVPGERGEPFRIGEATEATVHLGRFAIADVRVSSDIKAAEASARAAAVHTGDTGQLPGERGLPPLVEMALGNPIYENALTSPESLAEWVREGPFVTTFKDGWLEVRSRRPDGPEGHLVMWCPQDFPENFQAEWEFQIVEPRGLCIVFFAAKGREGQDIFDPSLQARNGIFARYINGDIACYHISYFSNAPDVPRAVSNLRKNPGFFLISNGPAGVPRVQAPGTVHRAILRKVGGHIQMSVDGKTIIDYSDDGNRAGPIYAGGKIGLRQMQWSAIRYRNFRVFDLTRK